MKYRPLVICLLSSTSIFAPAAFAQTSFNVKRVEFGPDGAIYLSSSSADRIRIAEAGHCSMAVTTDNQTFVCEVARASVTDPPTTVTNTDASDHLEIFYLGGQRKTIDAGGLIRDLHFWNGGSEVVVQATAPDKAVVDSRYDLASATLLESVPEPSSTRLLPEWAKSQSQLDDESVNDAPQATQEREKWIARLLRQVDKLHPGMKRSDLSPLFTTEGGLSTRSERTYVYANCAYVKIRVTFKPVPDNNAMDESPDDIIESISKPFLEFSVMD